MADNIVYNTAPPVASDFQVKQNSSGSWDVINTNTGIYEGNYNTKVAADTYTNQKVAGVSEKASQAAAVAADTGQPSDSNTTATNTTSANVPTGTSPATVTNTTPNDNTTTTETVNGVTNTVTTTPPTSDQPSNQKVASVSIDPGTPAYEGPGIGEGAYSIPETVTTPAPVQKTSIGQDWRIRLSLASSANYLYKQEPLDATDILYPLKYTDGVIFPYLPKINVTYKANYHALEITHTNYKNWFYTNSSVDEIQISAEFTAQDNEEAKYMLAVIHFFRSVTKMFYGQDSDPRGGTPPPLCYITGLGAYQFNNHPLVISNFGYNLPNDVDYVRTETNDAFTAGGITTIAKNSPPKGNNFVSNALSKFRLGGAKLNKGAVPSSPNFSSITKAGSRVTYVPSKIELTLTAYPVVSRKDISERFKLNGKDGYSSGALTKGGIW